MNSLEKKIANQLIEAIGPKLYEAYSFGHDAGMTGTTKATLKEFMELFRKKGMEQMEGE